jgi:hypothetical protein
MTESLGDQALAQAIVDTVREPLLVLDSEFRVVTASRSFYLKFQLGRSRLKADQFTQSPIPYGTFLS